jgi:methyl-accepting chemotaxis protein
MSSRKTTFIKTIRGKIIVYTSATIFLMLATVIGLHIHEMYSRLLRDSEEKILYNTMIAAGTIEANNLIAVNYAKAMAFAQESGLFGRRAESVKYLYAVTENNPQFFDAYTIYEPDADHQDEQNKNNPGSDSQGRFNAVVNNVDGKYELTKAVNMETSLYYQGLKEKLQSGSEEKYMITEPYIYEGVMMVEQTYPIVVNGKFVGITGVDRTLSSLSQYLLSLKPYKSADFILISRMGGIISATLDQNLNTRKIDDTPYRDILNTLFKTKRERIIRRAVDPHDGKTFFYAGVHIKTGNWTLAMRVSQDEILLPIRNEALKAVAASFIGLCAVFGILFWISSSIAASIRVSVDAAQRIADGDFTSLVTVTADDETGQLLTAINTMTGSLNELVGQVKRSCVQVTTSATQIAASAMQLEASVSEQAASTHQVSATAQEISNTSGTLLKTMNDVTEVAAGTAKVADSGRSSLANMESTMQRLVHATDSISTKLAVIDQKANDISGIINTITKVADQTNLLSLNASIEAEKAGEMGRGFSVVAKEIRRLADQTAVATLKIEQMVKDMQSAVSVGVVEMNKFAQNILDGMGEITRVSAQLEEIIVQVQTLTPRFAAVNEGMESQTHAAQQISEAIVQLSEAALHTSESVVEFHQVTDQLNEAANTLRDEVSRFKVTSHDES